jgi:hypothetical protein
VKGRDGVDAFSVGVTELVDESLQNDIAIAILVSPA